MSIRRRLLRTHRCCARSHRKDLQAPTFGAAVPLLRAVRTDTALAVQAFAARRTVGGATLAGKTRHHGEEGAGESLPRNTSADRANDSRCAARDDAARLCAARTRAIDRCSGNSRAGAAESQNRNPY